MIEHDKGGRPPHTPTERDRKTVQAMASYGVPQDEIALVIGIDPKTLRKHYGRELTIAATVANSTVAQSLFQIATMQDHTAAKVAAAKFWLECRAGWKRASAEPQENDLLSGSVGKKAQQAHAAATAGAGTEWGDDLIPPGMMN
jgi:hypothetical protein